MTDPLDPRLRHVAKQIAIADHGTIEEQKNALVAEITCMFGDPQKWPMTDADRIEILKRWYTAAVRIRNLERA